MSKIYFIPVGEVHVDFIKKIVPSVKTIFNFEVFIKTGFSGLEFSYDIERKQYFAPLILKEMKKYVTNDTFRLVGITDVDLYDIGLNFIFGEASGKCCIVSLNRFRPCKTANEENILVERVKKTVIHELGHSFGLMHCKDPKCVMFFSNWVGDTDRKQEFFCEEHKKELERNLKL